MVMLGCHFIGKGGMTTENVDKTLTRRLDDLRPDIVFVHIGGNDISSESEPVCIYRNICELIDTIYSFGTKTVFIGEICRRGHFKKSPSLTVESLDKQRNSINKKLKKQYGPNFISFPDINFPQDYDLDRVDFSQTGQRKYFYAIRRVLCSV